jgi:hypothetical protein
MAGMDAALEMNPTQETRIKALEDAWAYEAGLRIFHDSKTRIAKLESDVLANTVDINRALQILSKIARSVK